MNIKKKYVVVILCLVFFINNRADSRSLINTSHLDHLYQEIKVNGKSMGIIHIYSEYPDYKWIGDDDEGIACVDDAARASIFYLKYYERTHSKKSLDKVKKILNFLFYMQAENGYFYNFIWKDYSINKNGKTSVAEPNWWSWRAVWALAEAQAYFKNRDKNLYKTINRHLNKSIITISKWLSDENNTVSYGGLDFPGWLPYETASDQAAILVKALCLYYETEKDPVLAGKIGHLCDGIIKMQLGDSVTVPYCAFLSWQNTWHAWGNTQSYALLSAAKILHRKDYTTCALNEVKYYYPYLQKENYFNGFTIEKKQNGNEITELTKYSQIAYGIRPIVFASLAAYEVSKDSVYASISGRAGSWLLGNNIAKSQMYDPKTGRCFDGIKDEEHVNKNSGAESTIEALLSILMIELNSISKKELLKYLNK